MGSCNGLGGGSSDGSERGGTGSPNWVSSDAEHTADFEDQRIVTVDSNEDRSGGAPLVSVM